MDFFPWLLIGHFLGDFVFQNNWMALNKKHYLVPCLTHCTIYTLLVLLCLSNTLQIHWWLFIAIFFSHIILDGTHFVDTWMKMYRIRSWDTCLVTWDTKLSTLDIISTIFGSLIYVVIDNTLHILMMMLFIRYMYF
jgi:hypothetical protein